jgi:pyrroline-5-carboxylate reductase
MKTAFIGGGNMASALIGGLLRRGVSAAAIGVVEIDAAARARVAEQFAVEVFDAVGTQLGAYDAIVLAVKPQVLRAVAQTLAPLLNRQLVISIAAGVRAADLSRWLGGHRRLVRSMPNTPALIGMGVTGVAALPEVGADDRALATSVLEAVGEVVWCGDETDIDTVTAISGSGPAYVFYFIEALQRAASEMGLDPAQARALALTTFTGAAQLAAQSNESLATLRERVTSKGGTTAAALASFAADGLADTIVRGAQAARSRSIELGIEMGREMGNDKT